jgi:hypothetical protein
MVGSVSDALGVPASAVKVSMMHGNRRALLSSVTAISIITVTSGVMSDMVLEKLREFISQGSFLTSMRVKSGLSNISVSSFTLTDITSEKQSVSDHEVSPTVKKGTLLSFLLCVVCVLKND